MSYMQEFEQELRTRLDEIKTDLCHDPHEVADWEQWAAYLTKFVKEKVLESYKNGKAEGGGNGGETNKRFGHKGKQPTTS